MKRYALLYTGLVGVMLVLFVLANTLNVPYLADPDPLRGHSGVLAGLVGVTLLVVDVVLPVPSSVVMAAHGALFGVALGSALSMVGSLGAFAVGFGLGRRGAAVITRAVPEDERRRADRFLARWGLVAIIVSRPVPILAETVAFAAGASLLRWRSALGAATLGYLPAASAFALAGTAAAPLSGSALVVIAVVALALAAAVVVARRESVGQNVA